MVDVADPAVPVRLATDWPALREHALSAEFARWLVVHGLISDDDFEPWPALLFLKWRIERGERAAGVAVEALG